MFNSELKQENQSLRERIEYLKDENKELSRKNQMATEALDSREKILRAELQVEINKAVEDARDEVQTIKRELAVYKKENEILTKAFENMGFDVKDMKEILNKLVDGLVAKNEIKLINTNSK